MWDFFLKLVGWRAEEEELPKHESLSKQIGDRMDKIKKNLEEGDEEVKDGQKR